MKPIAFKEANTVFALGQPQYLPLPSYKHYDNMGRVTSCWRLTLIERLRLLWTGRLWFTVATFNEPLQPQRPRVEKPNMPRLTVIDEARNLAKAA